MASAKPEVVRTVADLRHVVAGWRRDGRRVALVPTMGALHAGHLALVRRAAEAGRPHASSRSSSTRRSSRPHEDLARYPRDEAGDLAKLAAERLPSRVGARRRRDVSGRLRHAHRAGGRRARARGGFPPAFLRRRRDRVLQAVRRGRRPTSPCSARRTTSSSASSARWCATSTCRSRSSACRRCAKRTASRCPRATPTSRPPSARSRRRCIACSASVATKAAAIARGTRQARPRSARGLRRLCAIRCLPAASRSCRSSTALCEEAALAIAEAGFTKVDYVAVRDAETLKVVSRPTERPLRVLAAAWLGATRLIDNVPGLRRSYFLTPPKRTPQTAQRRKPVLAHPRSRADRSISLGPPGLGEERLERAVEAQDHEPALAGHGLDPVAVRARRPACVGPK